MAAEWGCSVLLPEAPFNSLTQFSANPRQNDRHTLERLLSLPARPDSEPFGLNVAMHYGQGVAAAISRALMGANGMRGPFSDFMFISVRLIIDPSLENATVVGALL
ncbi:hypothetical protein AnigIFM50267_009887 [Aspergillus niger]|nr:hypothetical protein AnigIFM50267_009887 [Aspergillus niger]GLA18138.1 hypothetical protein AnigIFM62618_005293 [Aspergillus niger]